MIATAVGVVMAEHHLNPDQAFALLATRSQRTNTKVVDLAQEILDHRDQFAAPPAAIRYTLHDPRGRRELFPPAALEFSEYGSRSQVVASVALSGCRPGHPWCEFSRHLLGGSTGQWSRWLGWWMMVLDRSVKSQR